MEETLTGTADVKGIADCLRAALAGAEETALANGASIQGLKRLSGGANMETWSFDWVRIKEPEPLILRRSPGQIRGVENAVGELTLKDEAALIDIAGQYGVPVPLVRLVLRPEHGLGQGYIMSRERGEALPSSAARLWVASIRFRWNHYRKVYPIIVVCFCFNAPRSCSTRMETYPLCCNWGSIGCGISRVETPCAPWCMGTFAMVIYW
jgi:hypothetical protein